MRHRFSLLLSLAVLLLACACPAQIPVSKEPRHHIAFENAWVRVLDVRIPPGDTSLMHKHETPSVFLVLTNTKTGTQTIIEPSKMQLTPGNIWFEGFYTTPRIHRVWNSDTSEFHVIDMELLNRDNKPIDPPLSPTSFTQLFDEKPVRGYRFAVSTYAVLNIPSRKAPIVVVGLNAAGHAAVNNKPFEKKGDFTFVPAGTAITITGGSGTAAEFALFELK